MPDEKLPLIIHPGSELSLEGPQGGRIVAEMVSGALDLSRSAQAMSELASASQSNFKVGDFELAEPDYRQILLWAKSLEMEPAAVIAALKAKKDGGTETSIVNGRIVKLYWTFDSLPIKAFEWVDGLVIEIISFMDFEFSSLYDEYKSSSIDAGEAPVGYPDCERVLTVRLPELRSLFCSAIGLKKLDVSGAPLLTRLDCSENGLAEVNLSCVPELSWLDCYQNKLTELDLSPVPGLAWLKCCDNRLERLDLLHLPQLANLWCMNNKITRLDLAGVPNLKSLICSGNQFDQLDISPTPHLGVLRCDGEDESYYEGMSRHLNSTAGRDTPPSVAEYLLSNIAPKVGRTRATKSKNTLSLIGLRSASELHFLTCSGKGIKDLDLSGHASLSSLTCSRNQLANLNLAAVPQLTSLYCEGNHLTHLDLSAVPHLKTLSCSANDLAELDIRQLRNLESLSFDRKKTRLIQRPDQNL
jgi:Leucine-rich repeat (LRR) protein